MLLVVDVPSQDRLFVPDNDPLRLCDEDNGHLVVCSYKFSYAGDRGSAEPDGRR